MNTQTRQALKMAIEAMETSSVSRGDPLLKTIQACKEALAQPTTTYEQPHGWMQQLVSETDGKKTIRYTFTKTRIGKNDIPIYFDEALEQPAQEPYGWMFRYVFKNTDTCTDWKFTFTPIDPHPTIETKAVYTHPAPSWQGLSDAVVMEIVWDLEHITDKDLFDVEFYRAIEQALKEKNHVI